MKLGIVGHAREKFTDTTTQSAKIAITKLALEFRPDTIVSGHSPMGGVDIWAEEFAAVAGLAAKIFTPQIHRWDAPGGYRSRNIQIANYSDVVAVVVCQDYPPDFRGMRFRDCYHCKGRNPRHIKSGGCWTAWWADGLGKETRWEIIEPS